MAKFSGVHHSAVYRQIRRGTAEKLNSNLQMIDICCAATDQRIHELHHVGRIVKEEKRSPEQACVMA
jgi:hypothetical protein